MEYTIYIVVKRPLNTLNTQYTSTLVSFIQHESHVHSEHWSVLYWNSNVRIFRLNVCSFFLHTSTCMDTYTQSRSLYTSTSHRSYKPNTDSCTFPRYSTTEESSSVCRLCNSSVQRPLLYTADEINELKNMLIDARTYNTFSFGYSSSSTTD